MNALYQIISSNELISNENNLKLIITKKCITIIADNIWFISVTMYVNNA